MEKSFPSGLEAARAYLMAKRALGYVSVNAESFHAFLLDAGWRASEVAAECKSRGWLTGPYSTWWVTASGDAKGGTYYRFSGRAERLMAMDATAGNGRRAARDAAGRSEKYPTPENYARDKWIFEQRQAGKTIREIIEGLESHPEFYPLESKNGVLDAVKRYADHIGVEPPKGRPGRKPSR